MLKDLDRRRDCFVARNRARLWKALWDEFPECQAEVMLLRLCGENLPAVLRGEIDPLNLLFPEGALTTAEILYQDSPNFRLNNLLVQKATRRDRSTIAERTRRCESWRSAAEPAA